MAADNATSLLLGFTERLSGNLSGVVIADTLDDLIFNALRPIFFNTDHVEQTLVEMLPFVASNARRKFTNMQRDDFVNTMFSVISGRDKTTRFAMLRKIGLERTVYISCLNSFAALASQHETLLRKYFSMSVQQKEQRREVLNKLRAIETVMGARPDSSIFAVQAESAFWTYHALDFKKMITEKYIRLAYKDSRKAQSETGLQVDEDQLFKDYVLSIDKAWMKYDSTKGTPTSFIRWWFMDAKTSSKGHEYGIAFSVPTSQRAKLIASGMVNFSSQIDEDSTESHTQSFDVLTDLIERQTNSTQGNLAIAADADKLAALMHDITYSFSEDEKAALRATRTKTQNGKDRSIARS